MGGGEKGVGSFCFGSSSTDLKKGGGRIILAYIFEEFENEKRNRVVFNNEIHLNLIFC